MRISEYLKKWEAEHAAKENLHVATVEENDNIYNVEMRVPANLYNIDQDKFDNAMNFLTRRSGGVFFAKTSLKDFRNGFLSLKVAFCNHGYSDEKLTETIRIFFEKLLPSLEK